MSWFESMRGSHLNGNILCIQRLPKDILVCHLLAILWAKGCESTRVIPIGGEQLNPGAGRSKTCRKSGKQIEGQFSARESRGNTRR